MTKKNDYIENINQVIGKEIYRLRRINKMSGVSLSRAIGVTCQQLYKYEKGINRVPTGRLMLIAKAFGKTIEHFYHTLEFEEAKPTATLHELKCREIFENVTKIRNIEHQNIISTLAKFLSDFD